MNFRWLLICCLLGGCSSAPINKKSFEVIIASPLKIRRPLWDRATPDAGPGGVDYHTRTTQSDQMDCVDPFDLIKETINVVQAAKCLKGLHESAVKKKEKYSYIYRLKLEQTPYFELEGLEDEETPDCLKKNLSKVLVAREFFFLVQEEKGKACYATSIDLDEKKWMGIRFPGAGMRLEIQFPMDEVPLSEKEWVRQWVSWSLTPFYYAGEKKKSFDALPVPERFCEKCFEKYFKIDPKILPRPLIWPSEDGRG